MKLRLLIFVACALLWVPVLSQNAVDTESALIDAVAGLQVKSGVPKALELLRDLAKSSPDNDAVHFYLAKAELLSGNIEAAVKEYETAAGLDPSNDEYKETLAQVYSNVGRNAESSKIYLELLERKPGKYRSAYTLTILGDKYLTERRDSLAMDSYEQALLYDPDYIPAILGKSELFRMHGNLAGFFALTDRFVTDRTISARPKCEYVRNILKRVDANTYRVWSAQLDSLVNHCVATHPSDSGALSLGGWWFYGTGQEKKGREYLDRYVSLYPDAYESHWIKLDLLNLEGDKDGMIRECRMILKRSDLSDDKKLRVLNILGDCLHEKGDVRGAYSAYDKALKIDSEYIPVLNNYAYFLCLQKKKLKAALKMSRITIEKQPDNPTYLDTYAWILHLMGRDTEAKPYFKHALLYGGKDNSELLSHYAAVLEALGEKDLSSYYKSLAESKK